MMTDTIARLDIDLGDSPVLRAHTLPSVADVDSAEQQIGVPFPPDYRQFLLLFGGAMVGPYPVFGLRPVEVMGDDEWSVIDVTQRFRKNMVPGCEKWVVFSKDHAGNPVGLDATGAVWIHDHDFGGISPLAANFEEYVRVRCLKLSQHA
jgi:hypothetical protein